MRPTTPSATCVRSNRKVPPSSVAWTRTITPAIFEEARALDSLMTAVEEVLYQTKLKSNQDMLNFPIKLNNKLAHVGSLASMGVYAPTEQMIGVRDEVTALIDAELAKWHTLRDERLPAFNALIRESAIDLIGVPEE